MDDTQKQSQQPVVSNVPPQDTTTLPPVSLPQQPQAPIGGVAKESGPLPQVTKPVEFIQPTEQLVPIEQELQDIGVESVNQNAKVTAEQKNIGINLSPALTPAPIQPTKNIQFSMSEEEAEKVSKENKVANSLTWLALMILKQYQKQKKENSQKNIV